jgi:excisionase family DNA binding protein
VDYHWRRSRTNGLIGEWKRERGIPSAGWRAALAVRAPSEEGEVVAEIRRGAARDYLTPEEVAEALSIHVQAQRAYVRSGKPPAGRLAGERAIRIRREDLTAVLEPWVPQQ